MARILVIDDSRLARAALRMALEKAGHEVTVADSAVKGLDALRDYKPDCITSDILMPGMDGREFLDVLRARHIETPVVMVTADIQETTRSECLRRGARAVVEKPLKGDDLLAAIQNALVGPGGRRKEVLSAEQLDALSEFVNMGVGRAAASLNDLVSSHVELSVPHVEVVPLDALHHTLGGMEQEPCSSVQMGFRGSLDGCAFLVFPQASALKLVTLLTGDESPPQDLDSIRSGTLTEVGNILINSVVGTLSNVLGRPLHYSLPVYAEEPVVGLLAAQRHEERSLILLAKTNFVIRQMQIEGNLLLLFELLDYVPLGVVVLDRDMKVIFWNACLEDWTETPRTALVGTDIRERFPHLAESRYMTRITELSRGGAPTIFSSQLHPHIIPSRLRGGRLRVQHTVAVAVPTIDGERFHSLLAIADVTNLADAMEALKGARDEAKRQAATDPLTGIANRRHFVDMAERMVAQALRYGRPCALLLLDLDGFKSVNDTHGHAVGDTVLRSFVEVCRRSLRDCDMLGRLGGDEFAVLLPETSSAMALVTAERLRSAVNSEVVDAEGKRLRAAVSIGTSGLDEQSRTLDALLKKADDALYEAKKRGRNRVVAG